MMELASRVRDFLRASRKALMAAALLAAYFGLDVSTGVQFADGFIATALVWLTPNDVA